MKIETDVKYQQLKEVQLDYILVYSHKDEEDAEELCKRLDKCGLKGKLYDDPNPFRNWRLENEIERVTDLVERSTFKFFLASNNLVDDTEDSDFITHKSEALMNSIRYRDQTVIPIWLVPKKDINRESSRALYGLMSLQGLNPNSKYFEPHVEKLNSMEMFKKMKEDREEKQKSDLQKYEEKKEEEEQQKLKALEARKKSGAMPKKAKTGSDSMPNGVTGGNGVINYINIQGSEVSIGDMGRAAQTSAPNEELLTSYHAPEEFWRSFDNEGAVGGAVQQRHVDQNDMRLEEMEHDGQSQQESMDSRNSPSSTLDNSTADISSFEQISP